jgi:PAS domain S-box-containing protein
MVAVALSERSFPSVVPEAPYILWSVAVAAIASQIGRWPAVACALVAVSVSRSIFYPNDTEPAHLLIEVGALVGIAFLVGNMRAKCQQGLIHAEGEHHRFLQIVDGLNEGVLECDVWGMITYANASARWAFGYAGSMEGVSVTRLIPAIFIEAHEQARKLYEETGKRSINWDNQEWPGVREDGKLVYLSAKIREYYLGDQRRYVATITKVRRSL